MPSSEESFVQIDLELAGDRITFVSEPVSTYRAEVLVSYIAIENPVTVKNARIIPAGGEE